MPENKVIKKPSKKKPRAKKEEKKDESLAEDTLVSDVEKTPKEENIEPAPEKKEEMKKAKEKVDISKPYINNSRPVIELVSALSYILFFLPLIFCRKEPFALYHANQALILWLFMAIFYLAFGFIPGINIYALPIIILFHILGIFYGMYNSAHGRARQFWLIGKIKIIKWN